MECKQSFVYVDIEPNLNLNIIYRKYGLPHLADNVSFCVSVPKKITVPYNIVKRWLKLEPKKINTFCFHSLMAIVRLILVFIRLTLKKGG